MSVAGNHDGAMKYVKASLAGLPLFEDEEMMEKTLDPNGIEIKDLNDSGYINEKNGYHGDHDAIVKEPFNRT